MFKKTIYILIVVVMMLSVASCSKNENPDNTKLATNNAVDFNVYYPADWIVETNEPKSAVISLVHSGSASGNNNSSIRVTALNLKEQFKTAKDYWKSFYDELNVQFNNSVSINKQEEITLDDVPAYYVDYKADVADDTYKFVQVVAIRNGYVYTITYTANEKDFDTTALDTVIKYFKFK